MKKAAAVIMSGLLILLSSCVQITSSPDNDIDGFIASLKGDPACGGYVYTNGAASYTLIQRGDDVRLDFISANSPDGDLCASRVDGQTVYADKTSYYVDTDNKYPLPVTSGGSVTDWIFEELKTYGNYTADEPVAENGVLYDVLTSTKTETVKKDVTDVACDKYEIFVEWKDGKRYVMNYYDFEDSDIDVFMGNVPYEISADTNWRVDAEKGLLYNTKTNETYKTVVTFLESYKPTGETEEYTKTANIYVDKKTKEVYKIKIRIGGETDEYTFLHPDKIDPVSIEGLAKMNDAEAEHAAIMASLRRD